MATDRDANRITGVLSTASLCGDCIARQTGLSQVRLDEVFLRVVVTVRVASQFGRCDGCSRTTTAHRIV